MKTQLKQLLGYLLLTFVLRSLAQYIEKYSKGALLK
jgi:hypothetical protein